MRESRILKVLFSKSGGTGKGGITNRITIEK